MPEAIDGVDSLPMLTAKSVRQFHSKISAELESQCAGLLERHPIKRYLSCLSPYDRYQHYESFRPALISSFDEIRVELDGAAAKYQQVALLTLLADRLKHFSEEPLPALVRRHCEDWFERIVDDTHRRPPSYYHPSRSDFVKDIAVCVGRAMPVGGAWLVECRRMNRSQLFCGRSETGSGDRRDGDSATARRYGVKIARSLGIEYPLKAIRARWRDVSARFKSYYVIHTVDRDRALFNSQQMNRAYGNIAELLKQNPGVAGVYRRSWFLDPALNKITPALSFLTDVPTKNGAQMKLCGEVPRGELKKVLSTSPERNRLYESGEYVPKIYAYHWARQNVLEWARQFSP